jgi:hypothetical protein
MSKSKFASMDSLSDWDDWSEDEPEWWLRHPLQRPIKRKTFGGQSKHSRRRL